MRTLLCLALCFSLLAAVGAAQAIDANGNYSQAAVVSPLGSRAPGDVLNTIYGPTNPTSGAGHDGTYLLTTSAYDGSAVIYVLDEATGTVVSTVPISDPGDFGLGYDTTRGLYVTTNASSDVIKTFDGVSPTPVTTWSYPGTGFVGLAYDQNRDVYWVCDWTTNMVIAVDAATGSTGTSYNLAGAGCTRPAGVGYDPVYDEILVGGRDQNMIFVLDGASGSLKVSFAAVDGSNNPQGLASTPRSTVWQTSWNSSELDELDVGHVPTNPTVDIKCNGGDAGVQVTQGDNVKIDFKVTAGIGAGYPVDIWVALKTPFGFFSYDGIGPYFGWNFGLGNAYYTGPLADITATALDHTLPLGAYKAFVGIDTVANGTLNLANIYTMDMVDFDVVPPPRVYKYDDGSTENLLAWTSGGDMCWLHRFNAYVGGETITEIHAIWGSAMYPGYNPGNGTPATVYVWDDPTEDGDPNDAVLVATEPTTVQNVDTDIYNIIPLTTPPTIVDEFYFGAMQTHSIGQYVAPIDQTTPYVWGNGFFCGTNTAGGFDPANLGGNQYPPAEWGNYWCVRAGY